MTAGLLSEDITAAINSEMRVTRSGAVFSVQPTVKFYSLSLLLVDAFFTQLLRNTFPLLSSVSIPMNYMQWNGGTAQFRQVLESAERHRREPSNLVNGQPLSLEQWTLHTIPRRNEWGGPRFNAVRFTHYLESYRPIFRASLNLIKPGIEDLNRDRPGTRSAAYTSEEAVVSLSAAALSGPTRDQIVREMDRQQGTGYGTYDNYARTAMVQGRLFGIEIGGGLRREFLEKLQRGETEAARRIHPDGRPVTAAEWGVANISGYQRREGRGGWHPWGLAIDIDANRNPYIMHEAGEEAFDRLLAPVYHRIARMLWRRDSVIPVEITRSVRGESRADRVSRLYDRLREEHEAMISYFSLMQNRQRLEEFMRRTPDSPSNAPNLEPHMQHIPSFWGYIIGDGSAPTADNLLRVMMRDYVILCGRSGPAVASQTYPDRATVLRGVSGDPPFNGRAPERGFLTIRKEIVLALTGVGLRWGAIDFGPRSGDVMHFDDGNGAVANGITRARATL